MGNFLVIVAPENAKALADQIFDIGLANAARIKNLTPSSIVQTGWAQAASFARLNGSGTPIVTEETTGSWLCTVGTWFHSDGYASGREPQLLERAIEVGAERLARELEGFFTIVFGDGREREVTVITDVIGSRHCFFRAIDQFDLLSTSSLLLASLDECSLEPISCEEFLRTGMVLENRTFFREVSKIAPARVACFAPNRAVKMSSYWSIIELDPDRLNGRQAVPVLSEKLVGAARKVGENFAHPVCDLTGGYDSRVIAAAFLAAGVLFETTVAGNKESADVVVSSGLSRLTGKPHLHLDNEPLASVSQLREALRLTDGGYDVVDYARIFSLHRRLSKKFDISINGSFGEIARGYWWELLWPNVGKRERLDARKLALRRYLVEPSSPQLYPPGKTAEFTEHFARVIERANVGLAGWANTVQMDNIYLKLRMQHWQGRIASSTDQIWPCLSPFMLRSVLETMLQIRARVRYRSLLVRMLLAELQPKLAAYPLEHGYPALPLTWSTWQQFLPSSRYFARKSLAKAENILFKDKRPAEVSTGSEPPRLQLLREEEVRELLNPEKMRLKELIETKRLQDFLDASRERNFPYEQQWNRVLSLEMALRVLHS